MIALIRKNLACSISSHRSFLYKSPASLLSVNFFPSSPKIYDLLLHKHRFSHELASSIASNAAQLKFPEKAESVISFLKTSGFTRTQLEKIVKRVPKIQSASVEIIEFKLKIFQDLGLSSAEVAKVVSSNPAVLKLSAENKLIPSISLIKGLLGSDGDVARLLMKSSSLLSSDLERTLMPNIEILKSCGARMDRILWLLYNHPRSLLIKPDVMRKTADKAKEMGVYPSSNLFVRAVRSITSKSEGAWEVKTQSFRNLGFSDDDMVTVFRKAPYVFDASMTKLEKAKELVLATGKFSISSIVDYPTTLLYSVEKRLKPRLHILGILESEKLIKKWPRLSTIVVLTDDKFFEQFIMPYSNEHPEVKKFWRG